MRLGRCLRVEVAAAESSALRPSMAAVTVPRFGGDDAVDLAAQVGGGLLELRHLVASEGVGIGERVLDGFITARWQVAEVAAVRRQEC